MDLTYHLIAETKRASERREIVSKADASLKPIDNAASKMVLKTFDLNGVLKVLKAKDIAVDTFLIINSKGDRYVGTINLLMMAISEAGPMGKVISALYKAHFKVLGAAIIASETATVYQNAFKDLFNNIIDLNRFYGEIINDLLFNKKFMGNGILTHLLINRESLKKIPLNNQEINFYADGLIKRSKQIVRIHDLLLLQMVEKTMVAEAISQYINKEVEKENIFNAIAKNSLQLSWLNSRIDEELKDFKKNLSSLLDNRNDWAQWCGKKQSDIERYKANIIKKQDR